MGRAILRLPSPFGSQVFDGVQYRVNNAVHQLPKIGPLLDEERRKQKKRVRMSKPAEVLVKWDKDKKWEEM